MTETSAIPLCENPIELLRTRLMEGTLSATPLCIAVIGWLCDFEATDPYIVAIHRTSEGQLLGQRSGDGGANDFLGSEEAFLAEIGVVCEALGFKKSQTRRVLDEARRRLT